MFCNQQGQNSPCFHWHFDARRTDLLTNFIMIMISSDKDDDGGDKEGIGDDKEGDGDDKEDGGGQDQP